MNSYINTTSKQNAGIRYSPSTPYNLYQTSNVISFLGLFSPLVLIIMVLSQSIFSQNVKGLVYLVFVAMALGVRSWIIQTNGGTIGDKEFIRYGKYGNSTLTVFLFAFTMIYLFIPMYQSGVINWIVVFVLFSYIFLDIAVKVVYKWIKLPNDMGSVIGDFVGGGFAGVIVLTLMYLLHIEKYMFFSDAVLNGTVCSRPQQQTFKCLVYKNGQLVQN